MSLLAGSLVETGAADSPSDSDPNDEEFGPEKPPEDQDITGLELFGDSGDNALSGGSLDDRVEGYGGDDTISGLSGGDIIDAGHGDDTIWGGRGGDYIDSGAGADSVLGGAGNDTIDGDRGFDTLRGDRGDDFIKAVDGALKQGRPDELFGGLGNDTLLGDDGDTIFGGSGEDVFALVAGVPDAAPVIIKDLNLDADDPDAGGADQLAFVNEAGALYSTEQLVSGGLSVDDGTGGNAEIVFQGRIVGVLEGITPEDLADDLSWLVNQPATDTDDPLVLVPEPEPDDEVLKPSTPSDGEEPDALEGLEVLGDGTDNVLTGGELGDQIKGFGGDDTISGLAGTDIIDAGHGDDSITGGRQGDQIDAGPGADFVSGGDGNDTIDGGRGVDTLRGDEGDDFIKAIDGALKQGRYDEVFGGMGNDTLLGDDGDTIFGGSGEDVFALVVGVPASAPVIFKDLNLDADDTLAGGTDQIAFINEAGVLFANEQLVANGLAVDDGADGHAEISYNGQVVGIVEGITSQELTSDFSWLANQWEKTVDQPPLVGPKPDPDDGVFTPIGPPAEQDLDGIELLGDSGDNALTGTEKSDRLLGFNGADTILGLDGVDLIDAGDGNDSIQGGRGDDHINAGPGSDEVSGGDGKDVIDGERGFDTIRGDGGDDSIMAIDGVFKQGRPDELFGGLGDDTVIGDDGDTIYGGGGEDVFAFVIGVPGAEPVIIKDLNIDPDSPDTYEGDRIAFVEAIGELFTIEELLAGGISVSDNSDGNAEIEFRGEVVAILEGVTSEVLTSDLSWLINEPATSSDGPPIFNLNQLSETILGTAGDDEIAPGDGSYVVQGQEGADLVDLRDSLTNAEWIDSVFGGDGNDTLIGDGRDILEGGSGQDTYEMYFDPDHIVLPVTIVGFEFGNDATTTETLLLRDSDGNLIEDTSVLSEISVVVSDDGNDGVIYLGSDALVILRDISGDITAETTNWIENLDAHPDLLTGDVSNYLTNLSTRYMSVQSTTLTGKMVAPELFGTNAVFDIHTDQGEVGARLDAAVDALDVEGVRFPAGQGDFNFFEKGTEGVDWLNVVSLEDDGAGNDILRPELTRFLDWAQDPNGDGNTDDKQPVTLVIPTKHISLDDYTDFAVEIEKWAEILLTEYPDLVTHIEIGNEYWNIGETEYGQKANMATVALKNGMTNAGIAPADEPDVIVQMAALNTGSEFHSSVDDRPFTERLVDANNQIIAQLGTEARDIIDGLVEHYYWNQDNDVFKDNKLEVRYIDSDYQVWDDSFTKELDLHLTEWNLRLENLSQNGMKSAGVLLEQFENMVDLGADSAHSWPAVHNTTNALAGTRTGFPVEDAEGRVLNSIRGAVVDLMSTSLPGMELVETDFSNDDGAVEINTYQDGEKTVIYVASRSEDLEDLFLDFTGLVDGFESAEAVRVGYSTLPTSSDGLIYDKSDGLKQADFVILFGEKYYLNEYDVRAKFTEIDVDSAEINVTLRPYEVVEFVYFK